MSRDRRVSAQKITRVYTRLAIAIAVLVGFEFVLFTTGWAERIVNLFWQAPWPLVFAGLLLVGWLGRRAAYKVRHPAAQVAAFAVYLVAKGLLVLPLLFRADAVAPGLIRSAAWVTLAAAVGLTTVAFSVRDDFSYLRGWLRWGGLVALVCIALALSGSVRLGTWFDVAMVALGGAGILYDTGSVLRRFRRGRETAAALSLFASVVLVYFYSLRLLLRGQGYGRQ